MADTKVLHEIAALKKVVIGMKQEMEYIKEIVEDKYLSEDDKRAIDETIKAEKAGKLKSMKEVFG